VHGEEILGLFRIGFELLAQTDKMSVDSASGGIVFVAPNLLQEPIATEDLAGVADEILEKFKLFRRNVDDPSRLENTASLQVDFDIGERVLVHFLGDYGSAT
jgi:hypothetical protein